MSFDALAWAAKQKPGNLAAKMVLLALANYAGETGLAYPSTAAIAEFGDMNHKTASAALDRLEALGLIEDTQKRVGSTKQIKVYRLNLESLPKTEASQKRKPPKNVSESPPKTGDGYSQGTSQNKQQSAREHEIPSDWRAAQFGRGTKSREIVDSWDEDELATQTEHFIAHHRGHGNKFKDWQDAWSTWVLNSKRFNRNGRPAQLPRPDRREHMGGLSSLDQQFTEIVTARRDREAGGHGRPALAGGGQGRIVSLPAPDSPGWDDGSGSPRMAAGGL